MAERGCPMRCVALVWCSIPRPTLQMMWSAPTLHTPLLLLCSPPLQHCRLTPRSLHTLPLSPRLPSLWLPAEETLHHSLRHSLPPPFTHAALVASFFDCRTFSSLVCSVYSSSLLTRPPSSPHSSLHAHQTDADHSHPHTQHPSVIRFISHIDIFIPPDY